MSKIKNQTINLSYHELAIKSDTELVWNICNKIFLLFLLSIFSPVILKFIFAIQNTQLFNPVQILAAFSIIFLIDKLVFIQRVDVIGVLIKKCLWAKKQLKLETKRYPYVIASLTFFLINTVALVATKGQTNGPELSILKKWLLWTFILANVVFVFQVCYSYLTTILDKKLIYVFWTIFASFSVIGFFYVDDTASTLIKEITKNNENFTQTAYLIAKIVTIVRPIIESLYKYYIWIFLICALLLSYLSFKNTILPKLFFFTGGVGFFVLTFMLNEFLRNASDEWIVSEAIIEFDFIPSLHCNNPNLTGISGLYWDGSKSQAFVADIYPPDFGLKFSDSLNYNSTSSHRFYVVPCRI